MLEKYRGEYLKKKEELETLTAEKDAMEALRTQALIECDAESAQSYEWAIEDIQAEIEEAQKFIEDYELTEYEMEMYGIRQSFRREMAYDVRKGMSA